MCEISCIKNQVINANVDLPEVDIARSAYASAFEFGPRDFDAGEIVSPLYLLSQFPPIGFRALGLLTLGFAPNF